MQWREVARCRHGVSRGQYIIHANSTVFLGGGPGRGMTGGGEGGKPGTGGELGDAGGAWGEGGAAGGPMVA
jgi:hypothetical protein